MRVNVDSMALNEPRIKRMARRLNVSHYDVLARLIHVWMVCYERRMEFIPDVDVDIASGELPGFVAAMVDEEMADREDEKTVRIRGVVERINFLESQSEKGKASGKRRREMSDELQKRTSAQQGFGFGSTTGSTEPRTYSLSPDLDQAPDQAPDHVPSIGVSRLRVVSPRTAQDAAEDPASGGGAPPVSKTQPGASEELLDAARRVGPEPPVEAFTLSHLLLQWVTKNNPTGRLSRAPERTRNQKVANWAVTIDRLNRIDQFTWGEIEGMIQWSQRHSFWSGTILGADALRLHWDKMASQRQRKSGAAAPNEHKPGPTSLAHSELDRLKQKAGA